MQTLADAPPFYVSESAALREMRTSQKPSGSLPFLVERSSQPTCPVRFCSSSRPGVCPPSAVALAIRKSGSGIAQTSVSTLPRRWCCNDVSLRASGFKTESREGLGRGGRRGAPDGCGSSNIRTSVICGYEPGVPPEAGHTGLNPHQTVRHGSGRLPSANSGSGIARPDIPAFALVKQAHRAPSPAAVVENEPKAYIDRRTYDSADLD